MWGTPRVIFNPMHIGDVSITELGIITGPGTECITTPDRLPTDTGLIGIHTRAGDFPLDIPMAG